MHKYYKLLALVGVFGLAGCPGGGHDDSPSAAAPSPSQTTAAQKAAAAQGSKFLTLYNAPNNSTPAAVNPGDAGPVNATTQPNNVL